MGNGILVFLLIVVISAIIGAVSQMMKNVQAAAPPPRRGAQPQQSGDEIDKFLEEIDRLRKRKQAGEPPVAQPVRSAVPVAEPVSSRRERAGDTPEFVPSRVTRSPQRTEPTESRSTATARSSRAGRPPKSGVPRVEDLPAATPIVATPKRSQPKPSPGTSKDEPTDFAQTLSSLLGGKDGLSLAIAMQEILNPPRCKRNPWERH